MQKIKQFIQNSNVLKNASLSMIGSILIRAVDLISIPIFTRILDTTVYGRECGFRRKTGKTVCICIKRTGRIPAAGSDQS